MKITLYIQNLKYDGCEDAIINRLSALKGISDISIKLQYDTITFENKNKKVAKLVMQILSKIGYPALNEKNSLDTNAKIVCEL